jgi:hypothetical protein
LLLLFLAPFFVVVTIAIIVAATAGDAGKPMVTKHNDHGGTTSKSHDSLLETKNSF